VGVAMAAGSGLLVDMSCPGVVVAGVTGKVHDRSPELLAGKAEHDLVLHGYLGRFAGGICRPLCSAAARRISFSMVSWPTLSLTRCGGVP
jgi:hypothetical protein